MNRLIRTVFFLLTLVIASHNAFAGGEPISTNASIRKEISRVISYPGAIESANVVEFVLVSFRIEPCGLITILETNTSNPAFEAYVIEKLEGMKFNENSSGEHHMRFTFRAEGL